MTDNDKKKQISQISMELWGTGFATAGKCEKAAAKLVDKGFRKQRDGENIGAVHPVDEFKCSVCGITLEGWSRVITDEDDGELYYYEYEFKYCPNCGARMKGGESGS